MSLAQKIAKNTVSQITGKALSTVLGLIAIALMTRSLGTEQFGWYITAVSFLQFAGILTDFGFTVTTANLLSEPKFDRQKIINTTFTWRLITSSLAFGVAPFIILLFPYPAPVKIAAFITAFSFFAISINNVFLANFQTKLKSHLYIIGEVIGRIVLVLAIALVSWQSWGFIPMMICITLGSFAFTGFVWIKNGKIKLEIDKEITRHFFYKIWPTALTVMFNAIYLLGDKVILPLYVSQEQVGLYGAAYRVIDIIIQVGVMTMGILMPLITFAWARNLVTEVKQRIQLSFDLMALILIPIFFGALTLSIPIMQFIAGDDFSESGKVLGWLIFAVLGLFLGITFGHIVLSANKQKQAIPIYAITAILSLIGYFIFIPKYGIYGAAGVSIFSEVLAGISLTTLAIISTKFIPNLKTFTKILLSSLLMTAVILFIQPLNVLLSIFIAIIVYGLAILALKTVSTNTIKQIIGKKSL